MSSADVVSRFLGGSLSHLICYKVSLSASKDNQEAAESREGGALRLVSLIQLNILLYHRNP
jgi:hypothetical protein